MTPADRSDPLDVIAAALSRLRAPRGPRPGDPRGSADESPFVGRPPFGGPPWGHGPHGRGPHGDGPRHPASERGLARFRLLDALAEAGVPLSVGEIGSRIGVDQPRASRLVQQGVDHDLVRREADPADARRTLIALTERGRAIVERFRDRRRGQLEQALAVLTDEERAELARLLTRVADNWPR